MRLAHRPRLALGLLIAVSAVLIAVDVHGDASLLRTWGATMAGPVQQMIATAGRPVQSLNALNGDAQRRIEELEAENTRLAAELWAARARQDVAAQWRAVGDVAPGRVAIAQVIAVGGRHGYGATVTIDAGTSDGVRPDLMVVNGDGLVGRVIEAGPHVATVLLVTDATATVGVRVSGSRELGLVSGTGGQGDGLLRLRLLDADAPLSPGQRVETFGSSGDRPYASGIPVGTVVRVDPGTDPLTRTALVRPAVRFTALDVVGVVLDSGKEERRAD